MPETQTAIETPESSNEEQVLAIISENPEELALLAESENPWTRAKVAENKNTPEEVLHMLTQDEEVPIQEMAKATLLKKKSSKITELPSQRKIEIRSLAPSCQRALAGTSTNPEELAFLGTSEDKWIRAGVAWNENTPEEVLRAMLQDENKGIQTTAALALKCRELPQKSTN